jgi:hypothetical protein
MHLVVVAAARGRAVREQERERESKRESKTWSTGGERLDVITKRETVQDGGLAAGVKAQHDDTSLGVPLPVPYV